MSSILLLGVLSIVHAVFLPGYLLLVILREDRGFLKTAILSFGLSLAFNYVAAVLMVLAGVFDRQGLLVVIGIEVLALIAIRLVRRSRKDVEQGCPARIRILGGCIALAAVIDFGVYAYWGFSTVFNMNDDVISWNRWALDWARGGFPDDMMNYPQLLPIALATIYATIGTPVQFFAKGIMALFPLMTVLIAVDLGLRKRSIGFLLAALFNGALIHLVFNDFINAGYADLPVAFFGFAVYYALSLAGLERRKSVYLYLAVFLVLGAASTKQAGLFMAAVFPLLAWDALHVEGGLPNKKTWLSIAAAVAVMAALILPWYLYVQWMTSEGMARENVVFLTETIHQGRDLAGRAGRALELLLRAFHPVPLFLFGLFLLAGLAEKRSRFITLTVTLPFLLIWAFFFSYDRRNMASALPFAGVGLGFGLQWLLGLATRRLRKKSESPERPDPSSVFPFIRPGRRGLAVLAVLLLGVLAVFAFTVKDKEILDNQTVQLRYGYYYKVNRDLYHYAKEHPFQGKIFTNYRYLEFLPELGDYFDRYYARDALIMRRPSDLFRYKQSFEDYLERFKGEFKYILIVPQNRFAHVMGVEVLTDLVEGIASGRFKALIDTDKIKLVEMDD